MSAEFSSTPFSSFEDLRATIAGATSGVAQLHPAEKTSSLRGNFSVSTMNTVCEYNEEDFAMIACRVDETINSATS